MAVVFDNASAGIDVAAGSARPAAHIGRNNITCHLTQGFDADRPGDQQGMAWTAVGHINFTKAPADSLDELSIGFIQFGKVNSLSLFYAGRTPREGSITIIADVPPALTQRVFLDSEAQRDGVRISPFTRKPPRFTASFPPLTPRPEINANTGDHPLVTAQKLAFNKTTRSENLLCRIIDEREFWTVFCRGQRDGKFSHFDFAHFHWKLRYDFVFTWRGLTPALNKSTSSFRPDSVSRGAPTIAALQPLLKDPRDPFMNDAFNEALHQSLEAATPPNRTESSEWTDSDLTALQIPTNFFVP
jgi:hypothetical protein